jgi:triosephosphate isomerase
MYVLVGHSERRTLFGECDATVGRKARVALDAGLVPVICVGETLAERDAGAEEHVLERQLAAVVAELGGDALGHVVIAYEPVWAIGTGRAASREQVQAVMAFIRHWLSTRISNAESVAILYGGSVKADSAAALFSLPDVDGALVGGVSLVAAEFISVCEAAVAAAQSGVCKSKVLDD